MVDEERLTRLLSAVAADIQRLRRLGKTPDLQAHGYQLDAVKYRFITAIEGSVAIAHHIVVSEGWEVPDSNADAARALASHTVIPADSAESMAKAAGFRNILVHQYGDVDDSAVVAYLDRLGDLDAYVSAVTRWMESQASSAHDPDDLA